MTYLNSNEPYQRVDNSVWGGIATGSAIALGGAGATDFALSRLKQTRSLGMQKSLETGSLNIPPSVLKNLSQEDRVKMGIGDMKERTAPSRAAQVRGKLFGKSRLGRVAKYAGIGLAGATVGGAIDAASDM